MQQLSRSKPSEDIYRDLDKLFQFLNDRLFDSRLPAVMFTLYSKKKGTAQVNFSTFKNGHDECRDEITLNARVFRHQPDIETLKAITECMVLIWQHNFGRPGRGCYRNREWANLMKSIGLQPSATGVPGGRETGDNIPSTVIAGGAFEQAALTIKALNYELRWRAAPPQTHHKGGRRFRFQCPVCKTNIWGGNAVAVRCEHDGSLFVKQ